MTKSRYAILAAAVAALTAGSAVPAWAQGVCAERDHIVTSLNKQYDEAPIGIGLMAPGQVLELLVSESGSWTLLVTAPSGRSCIIGAGENWEGVQTTMTAVGEPA